MITGINESKILTNVNVDLMEKKCNSDQLWNNNKCRNKCKKCYVCKNVYIWNPATCSCEKENI